MSSNNYIKDYITTTLLRKDGKLNSAIIRRQWFLESNESKTIDDLTSFLPIDTSITEKIYCIMNDISTLPICPVCNIRTKAFSPNFGVGYCNTCSDFSCKAISCNEKGMQTKIEKYGYVFSPEVREGARQRAHLLNEKGKKTIKEKYGVDNVSQIAETKTKVIQTRIERFGSNTTVTNERRERLAVLRSEKTQLLSNKTLVKEVVKRTNDKRQLFNVTFTCNECSTQDTMFLETYRWRTKNLPTPCTICSGVYCGSIKQFELTNFIKSLTDKEVISNDKEVLCEINKQVDVYVPHYNVAFEFDGLFWHSFNSNETYEERRIHLTKTERCEGQNIQLVHIFENEWDNKNEIVKSCIKSIFGCVNKIPARKCNIQLIDSKSFFNENHLQGYAPCTTSYGLFYNDQIVAAMSFGVPRFNKNYDWELIRYANKIDTQVIGGASKLFKHFIKQHLPKNVISYADRRWSMTQKCMYTKLGFDLINTSFPSYYYFKSQEGVKLFNRISFQKHKLKSKLKVFDENKTEAENMFDNGYRRIWDCGNNVFVWENKLSNNF